MARMTKEEREARHQKDLIRVPRIEKLMLEQGKRPVDLARLLNMSDKSSYLTVVKNNQTTISDTRLSIIAHWLDTTIAYLNGETDNPRSENGNRLNAHLNTEEQYIIDTYRMCTSYEAHRRLLNVCEQLRSENALGNVTTA